MASTTPIPIVYRIYFTWMDPIISLITTVMMIISKDQVLASFNPLLVPRDPRYDILLYFCAAAFAMIAIYQGILLRYTDDIGVWKISNFGVVVLDFVILAAMIDMHFFGAEGLSLGFRADDVMNYVMTTLAIVMRLGFIAEVGVKRGSRPKTN